jgi:hypothetical protein
MAGRFRGRHLVATARCGREPGETPPLTPIGGGSLRDFVAGEPSRRLRREGDGGRCASAGPPPFWLADLSVRQRDSSCEGSVPCGVVGTEPQSPARLESGLFAVGGPAGFCTVTYRADVPVCSFRLQGGALLRECHVVETACSSRSRCHSSGNGMARNICPV